MACYGIALLFIIIIIGRVFPLSCQGNLFLVHISSKEVVPTFADRGCCVVSATDSGGRSVGIVR
jgi:hypothetical protein